MVHLALVVADPPTSDVVDRRRRNPLACLMLSSELLRPEASPRTLTTKTWTRI